MINYDDFKEIEIRAGKIISAEKVPETDKLLKLSVDFNEFESAPGLSTVESGDVESKDSVLNHSDVVSKPRQIISGISVHFPDPTVLVGKTCMFVTNLEPRTIKGLVSNGMILAVSTPEGGFSLLEPNSTIPPGTRAS